MDYHKAGWHTRQGKWDTSFPIDIVRLAPGDGRVTLAWRDEGPGADRAEYTVSLYELTQPGGSPAGTETAREEGTRLCRTVPAGVGDELTVDGLDNDREYGFVVRRTAGDIGSRFGLFRPGKVPGTVVNYLHPRDDAYAFSGRYTCSPSLVKLPGGRLLISHDVYARGGGQNLTRIYASDDGGHGWSHLSDIFPCFWGTLFIHGNGLYLLGTSTAYGELLIGRSDDGGRTWTPPAGLVPAGSTAEGGCQRTPFPPVVCEGRIWVSLDYGSFSSDGFRSCALSAPVDSDLLDPGSWSVTDKLRYDPAWPGADAGIGFLEGNLALSPEGKLLDILRYASLYGRAGMLEFDPRQPWKSPVFCGFIDFEGSNSKFEIRYDEGSGMYIALVNRASMAGSRRP